MYNGNTIFFTNIEDSLGMDTFIKSNSFSRLKIKRFNKELELFKIDNAEINQRW